MTYYRKDVSYYDMVYERIWDTQFWLPNNITWQELGEYTKFDFQSLLIKTISLALLIYLFRIFFENYVSNPIAIFLKVPDKKIFNTNPKLEPFFRENQFISESVIMLISRETDLSCEFIKNWFRDRKNANKPSPLQKFNECCWRFTFYSLVWTYGVYILWDKSWTWNTSHCWIGYPRQHIDSDIYYYYLIEISFYLSLLASQFTDIKRKDFWQMFLHHIITLSLLLWSLMCNFQRVGSLVLLLHDTADPFLELAKMGSYAKINKICDPVFAIFTLVWLLSRLIAFPFVILKSTTFDAMNYLVKFPAYYYFNALLYCLQVMHFIWFYMILRVAYKSVFKGIREDDRSECSSSDEKMDEISKDHKHNE